MNSIVIYMQQIPKSVSSMIRYLNSSASTGLVQRLVTQAVNNIDRMTNKSVELAESTESAFENVMYLLGEVLEATQMAKGGHSNELTKLQMERNASIILLAEMEKAEAQRKQHYETMKETVNKARDSYEQALKEIPTGWKALVSDAFRCLAKAGASALENIAALYSGKGLMFMAAGLLSNQKSETDESGNHYPNPTTQTPPFETSGRLETMELAAGVIQGIERFMNELSKKAGTKIIDPQFFQALHTTGEVFLKTIADMPANPVKQEISDIIGDMLQASDQGSKNRGFNISSSLKNIIDRLQPFATAAQMAPQNEAPLDQSAFQKSPADNSQNEVIKAKIAETRLSNLEKNFNQIHIDHMAALERTAKITAKLATIKMEEIQFEDIIQILNEAFMYLSELRTQWHKLVAFFASLSKTMRAGFYEDMQRFLDPAREAGAKKQSKADRQLLLDLLIDEKAGLNKRAKLLYIMSRLYFEVSQKHLMPRLAHLSKMLTAKDDATRNSLLKQLESNTIAIQAQVKELMLKRQKQYKLLIKEKKDKLANKMKRLPFSASGEKQLQKASALLPIG